MVGHHPLEVTILVRIQARQLFVATAPQSLRHAIYNSDEDTDTERSEVEVTNKTVLSAVRD